MKRKYWFWLCLIGCILLTACHVQRNNGEYKEIVAEEARALLDEKQVVLLDVRTADLYVEGQVIKSINVPMDELEKYADEKLNDRHQVIIVYGQTNQESLDAAKLLASKRYTNIRIFGGLEDWPYEVTRYGRYIENPALKEANASQDEKEKDSKPTNSSERTVEVYYMNMLGKTAIDEMLLWYQETYPESPKINVTTVQSMDQFNRSVEENGLPDLLLLDKQHMDLMANPYQWIEKGAAADLSEWMALDQSFDETQYLDGVMEAGRYAEGQYMIPLSVRFSYIMVPESQAADLLEAKTSNKILKALLARYEENVDSSESYPELRQFYSMSAGPVMALYELMEQIDAIQIDREQRTVKIDEGLFEQAVRYMRYQQNAMNQAMQQGILQQSYNVIANQCTTFTSNANVAFALHYMENANKIAGEGSMQIVPFPWQEMEDTYAACVTTVGLVGVQSENKEEAYQVLRRLMDIPAHDWQMIYGGESLTETPVNRQTAQDLVKLFSEDGKGPLTVFGESVDQCPLQDTQVKRLNGLLDQIQKAYVTDYEIYVILAKDLGSAIQDETADIQRYAQLVQSDIEEYLAEKR